jgi:hypothetical protein
MILLCNLTAKNGLFLLADLSEVNHIIFEFVAAVQITALPLTAVKRELRNDYDDPLIFSLKKLTISSGRIDSVQI